MDSEHKKNLQSDSWRLFQLEKNLSNPDHPYSQFGTGNLETLQDAPGREGIDVRDELIKFHSKYYSANIMKLVILGRGMSPVQLCSMTVRYEVSTFLNSAALLHFGSSLEPLDQLAEWAIEKFSPVRNLDITPPANTNPPWTEKELLVRPWNEKH